MTNYLITLAVVLCGNALIFTVAAYAAYRLGWLPGAKWPFPRLETLFLFVLHKAKSIDAPELAPAKKIINVFSYNSELQFSDRSLKTSPSEINFFRHLRPLMKINLSLPDLYSDNKGYVCGSDLQCDMEVGTSVVARVRESVGRVKHA